MPREKEYLKAKHSRNGTTILDKNLKNSSQHMKTLSQFANEQDYYIFHIIQLLSERYQNVEATRGKWIVTFIYYSDGARLESKVKKSTLEHSQFTNKLPLTIKKLLR